MSGRRRRSEIFWDGKEEKAPSAEFHSNVSPGRSQNWSKSEAHDDLMHGNLPRSPSWEGNKNGPKDADIRRDRNRMYSHPTYDGWEQQHSTHPSDDNYGLPYRPQDKAIGGNVRMSRERARERSRSPYRSRSRSWDHVSRSSRESTRGHRHETNASYPDMRNNPKDFASRGGGNNVTKNWSRRTDYKDSTRYNDYPHRTAYDGHRNTRIPCRYFAAGNCNRDNCRFSHDVPEAAKVYDDNRNLGNKNRRWHDDQWPRDDLNAKSNLGEMEKRSWNSSLWDDVKSGGFDETLRLGHTSDGNNTTWDSRDDKKKLLDEHASRDASCSRDVGKSYPDLNNKKRSWDGPTSWDDVKSGCFDETSLRGHSLDENNTTWDSRDDKKKLMDGHASRDASGFHDFGKSHPNLDNKKPSWDGPTSWDDLKSSGFDEKSPRGHTLDENNTWDFRDDKKKWLDGHVSRDASGFRGVGKSHPNLDIKKPSWDGPTSWDDVKSGGFDETSRQDHTLDENITTWDFRDDKKKLLDGHASRDASGFHDVGKSHPNLDNKKPFWDGPTSWDDVRSGVFDETSHRDHTFEENITTWDSRDDKKKFLDGRASRDASGFHDVGKSPPNLDNKKSTWGGPTSWDGVSGSGFSSISNAFQKHEDSSKESLNDDNAKGRISAKFGSNIDGNKTEKWDGPLWDEVSEPVKILADHNKIRKWAGPGLNNVVPEETNQQVITSGTDLIQSVHDMNHSYLKGPEQSHMPFDGTLNAQVEGAYVHMENQNKGGKPLIPLEVDVVSQPKAVNDANEPSLTSQQANPPPTEMSDKKLLPQLYTDLHLTDAIDYLKSLPHSAYNQDSRTKETGMLSGSVTHDSKVGQIGVMEKKIVEGFDKKNVGKKDEEGDDEKAMRQFKVGLVDFVKDILKPKWKEGKMSREVHKSVVKKVVEKVTTTIQIPKTQPKIEQYLAYSKPKITKLVEAYMERLLKA